MEKPVALMRSCFAYKCKTSAKLFSCSSRTKKVTGSQDDSVFCGANIGDRTFTEKPQARLLPRGT
jgi:hypothetical protein